MARLYPGPVGMEFITSSDLKDLFQACPRLKTKLSGQEIRAISDTIDKRVMIQHGQLLFKIARLEMYQSAFDERQKRISKIYELDSPQPKANQYDKNYGRIQSHGFEGGSEKAAVKFVLPSLNQNNESQGIPIEDDDHKLPRRPGALNAGFSKEFEWCRNNTVDGKSVESGSCNAAVLDNTVTVRRRHKSDTAHRGGHKSCSSFNHNIYVRPNIDKVTESVKAEENDKLIDNFTRQVDFMKSIINERSDYDRIVQESLRQQHLINQLRLELSKTRKDNTDLLQDIQRMRYALKFTNMHCSSCPSCDVTSSIHQPNCYQHEDMANHSKQP